jgi:5-methylcytosine-specific restriction endonuclease McrA
MIHPKAVPLRLALLQYENLRQQILRRDGWRCQSCGAMSNLEVHHREFRSHAGEDTEDNLITLCTRCHASVHATAIRLRPQEADGGA